MHTPGPWQCVGPNEEATHIVAMPDDATKLGTPIAWAVAQHERGEGPANARLIAAAPDLLEALKAAVSQFDKLPFESEWIKQAKESISKAVGEFQQVA